MHSFDVAAVDGNSSLQLLRYSCALKYYFLLSPINGFGGLGVACWPFSTQVRGFKPGRSRWIFGAKKSSARLPSEGK